MIDARELRIGNIVNINPKYSRHNEKYIEVESICHDEINSFYRPYDSKHLFGVELTEDLLLKCGFCRFQNGTITFVHNGFTIWKCGDMFLNNKTGVIMKTLHHLQNCYYFEVNKELEINL